MCKDYPNVYHVTEPFLLITGFLLVSVRTVIIRVCACSCLRVFVRVSL